ncbi:taspase, threonine aspartase, 1 [Mortierella sp. GBA43]|nr:taspase, threonine aspartase, 1 [Mortierella sp. GBA43]
MLQEQRSRSRSTTLDCTATLVVEHMIRILEDDPVTNAGTGSNLNLNAQVECDASIMNGTTLGFGSVGAVSEFKNPISVAAKLLHESDQGPLSLGRIPPIMLVGSGVSQWVDTMGFTALERVPPLVVAVAAAAYASTTTTTDVEPPDATATVNKSLVTYEALHSHVRFQTMLQKAVSMDQDSLPVTDTGAATTTVINQDVDREDDSDKASVAPPSSSSSSLPSSTLPQPLVSKKRTLDDDNAGNNDDDEKSWLQDTVGAICVDNSGHVAAGVSSGGIAMKFPGRVSEAALFGAGCWAQDPSQESPGFACSMTGAGEQISKTLLARTCTDTFLAKDDSTLAANTVLDKFMASPLLQSYDGRHAGYIAVKLDPVPTDEAATAGGAAEDKAPRIGEFVFAHTTKTMGVAFMSARDLKPTAIMSQRKPGSTKTVSTRMVRI